jgi:hypothetical protein
LNAEVATNRALAQLLLTLEMRAPVSVYSFVGTLLIPATTEDRTALTSAWRWLAVAARLAPAGDAHSTAPAPTTAPTIMNLRSMFASLDLKVCRLPRRPSLGAVIER